MEASRARVRPAASGRFDTTSAIVAGSARDRDASTIAWRLLPRPEMRTAMRGTARPLAVNVPHSAAAHDGADHGGVDLACRTQHVERPEGGVRSAGDDQADSHVERAEHF